MEARPDPAARYAAKIRWAAQAMDERFTPYSAAEKVMEMVNDEPATFEDMPGVDDLWQLVETYRHADPDRQAAVGAALRGFLADLAERLTSAES